MSVTGAYELGRRAGEKEFFCVRVYEVGGDPFSNPFEEFLLGEPVWMQSIVIHGSDSEQDIGPDEIFWIQELFEREGKAEAGVSRSRNKPATLFAPVTELEKLPDMVRLAVEYAL